jgi:arylsulfatase A-like enzyme
MNLILVTIDCMRRDRVSAYGYPRATTPFLDRLLDGALHCSSAHSASPWTCPSVCTMLTGLYPHRHGGGLVPGEWKNLSRDNLPTRLPDAIPSVADLLAQQGYSTAAFGAVWNAHLSIPGRFHAMWMMQTSAKRVVGRGLRWIREQEGTFFLWLHFGDAHEPLDVPLRLRGEFGRVPWMRRVRRWDYTKASDAVPSPRFERYRDARVRLYDAALRSVDAQLASMWEGLKVAGVRDRTLVVITSDHGEEFWEHREEEMASFTDPRDVFGTGHGHNLFQVHLLVPLILAGPGIEPRQETANVTSADIVPTIAEVMGVDAGVVDGRSLLSATDPLRPILAEAVAYGYEKRAVIRGDRKLLVCPGDGIESLYELGPDRREAGALDDPAEATKLRDLLPAPVGVVGERVQATEEIVDHLRDLGYLE